MRQYVRFWAERRTNLQAENRSCKNSFVFDSLPENVELIPNLKHLYLVFSGVVPSRVEPLLDRENPLESVTVGESYWDGFHRLNEKIRTKR